MHIIKEEEELTENEKENNYYKFNEDYCIDQEKNITLKKDTIVFFKNNKRFMIL